MKTEVLTWIKKGLKKRGLNVVGPTHYSTGNGPLEDHVVKINELKIKVPKKQNSWPVQITMTIDNDIVLVIINRPMAVAKKFCLGDPDLIESLARHIHQLIIDYAEDASLYLQYIAKL